MASVNVYLNFDGQCEEAFAFYKSIFGGDYTYFGRYSDMPVEDGSQSVSGADANKILHVSLPIGNNTVLMGCDTAGEWALTIVKGNNFAIMVNADSQSEAQRIFDCLSENGSVTMPMDFTFWGSYFGMLTDKYGIHWMVSFEDTPESK